MEPNMVIVGAGIAGLSTGYYARLNGYRTTILEANAVPGGLCAAWTRKGYTFDISMHMLIGSKGGPAHRMWQELGVVDGRPFHYHTSAVRVESGATALTVSTDRRTLESALVALSPEDARLSREFARLVTGRSAMGAMSLTPPELAGLRERLRGLVQIVPLLGIFLKYRTTTIQEFAARFRDPFLRDAVRFVIDSPGWPMQRFPMSAMAGILRAGVTEAGVPSGGSQRAVFRIADRYREIGGGIRYGARVTALTVEDDRVVGVHLEDGEEIRADEIVWAADGHTAIFDILGGRYVDDRIRRVYEDWIVVRPIVHVMIGVARDMRTEPPGLVFRLDDPVSVAGEDRHWMQVIHHSFDPGMAPEGSAAVEAWYATDFDYWKELAQDPDAYRAEKTRIADDTIARLNVRWPGFADQVEVIDVVTPTTYVRYTGNWRGSPDGWYITPENMMQQTPIRSLPGLDGFHMVGQWTVPFAGTVMSALTGRQLVELLCRRRGRPFATQPGSPQRV